MLTITSPIEIKAKTAYMRDPEAFYNRIVGNYSLMETKIAQEDLLHIAATPPEIYVSEGEGMTSILARNERNETNINKVNILNNVINRIIASANVDLTYQDRVFITDALYKLGIRDEKRFMNAFYRMSEETKNTNTLINLYLERGGELRDLIESLETRERQLTFAEGESTQTQRENFLYRDIIDRLRTGPIYEIVSNFNRSVEDNEIDAREYSIANQSYISQHILLSVLRERAGVGEADITFLSGDTYEESIENEESNVVNVRNEITSAVLMDMLRNIYHTGFNKFYSNNDTYYRFEDTFFKSSDQTFLRLVSNTTSDLSYNIGTEEYITENNRLSSSEIELLESERTGELSAEEAQRITETVNAMNIQNEMRRQRYVEAIREIRQRESVAQESGSGMKQTREDGVLALTDPQKLMEKLQERTERRIQRQNDIIRELQMIFPERTTEIYQLISDFKAGDINVLEQNLIRTADVGELIYDIQTVEAEARGSFNKGTAQSQGENRPKSEGTRARGDLGQKSALSTTEDITYELTSNYYQTPEEDLMQHVRSSEGAIPEAGGQFLRPDRGASQGQGMNWQKSDRTGAVTESSQRPFGSRPADITYEQTSNYYQTPEEDLMQHVRSSEEAIPELRGQLQRRDEETQRFLDEIKAARREEGAAQSTGGDAREPVETVHRQTQSLTVEELNEQLEEMQHSISKQIKKVEMADVVTENRTTNVTQVTSNDNVRQQLRTRDIEQMIENGIKSQMNTISNQVMGKIERQMKNEKMRRGY
ncbi:MAG: hypothetical protein K6E91_02455 [Butyrivibrio sp.]|nr:hypothetical protein [Butyrivibrio sp.]